MGHVNAALEWLVQAFNDMWPIVVATFVGAWLAFQYLKRYEKAKLIAERRNISQFISFVLKSQKERLESLRAQHLEPNREHARRAVLMEAVVIHDDFPRLDVSKLPVVFESSHIGLMNEVIECEHGFLEIARLLRQRDHEMTQLDEIIETGEEAKQQRTMSRRRLNSMVDRVYDLADKLHGQYPELTTRIDELVAAQTDERQLDLVDYLAWMILAAACATVGVFFFSHWAVTVGSSNNFGLDISLVSALVYALSLYGSIAMCLVIAIMSLYALVKRLRSFAVYFWTFLIAALPTVFLLWKNAS